MTTAKCVIVPSIATSMLPDTITIHFARLSWEEFTAMLKNCERTVNFVRHKPTNDLIATVIAKFETGFEYKISVDDTIFVIGLKTRTSVPGADVAVAPSDLLIYIAKPVK